MKSLLIVLFIITSLGACVTKNDEKVMRDVSKPEIIRPAVQKGDLYASPEIKWPSSDGKMHSFKEMTRGKVVLVNFWATWCIPCKITLASLRAVQQKYSNKDVVILGISTYETTDPAYRLDFVSKFVAERDFGYPVLLDEDDKALWGAFGMKAGGVPTMVFINRDGFIEKTTRGSMSEKELTRELDKLLKQNINP